MFITALFMYQQKLENNSYLKRQAGGKSFHKYDEIIKWGL